MARGVKCLEFVVRKKFKIVCKHLEYSSCIWNHPIDYHLVEKKTEVIFALLIFQKFNSYPFMISYQNGKTL